VREGSLDTVYPENILPCETAANLNLRTPQRSRFRRLYPFPNIASVGTASTSFKSRDPWAS
jgi:hypothetical protein